MAGVKISDLPVASSVGASDLLAVVQGSTTRRATANQVAALATTSAPVWTVQESSSAPTQAADTAKLYALDVSGRTEPSIILSDGTVVPYVQSPVRSVSSNATFNQRDETVFVTANTVTLTLPAARAGRRYEVCKTHTGTNTITIARAGSEQIQGVGANYVLPDSGLAAYGCWSLRCDGTNWWVF